MARLFTAFLQQANDNPSKNVFLHDEIYLNLPRVSPEMIQHCILSDRMS